MEKIEKLLNNAEFEKALEQIEASKIGHYEKAYFTARALIGLNKFDDAMDVLAEELQMPYIPMEFDQKFNDLYDQVIALKRQLAQSGVKTFSIEEIAQTLNEESDFETLIHSVIQLKDYNIRKIMTDIENFLKDEKKNSVVKTLIIEVLQNQEIDCKLVVTKNGLTKTINPMEIVPVLETDLLALTSAHLEKNMAQDPSKLEFCYQSLDNLMFDLFPFLPEVQDAKTIAWAIENYVCSLFGQEAPLPTDEISISTAKKYIDKLTSY